MEVDAALLIAALPAVMLAGLSKGGFGSAFGMLATPVLALAVPPVQAAAIMLPLLLAGDAVGLLSWRGKMRWSVIAHTLPGAVAGIATGWATAAYVDDNLIRGAVGAIALTFGIQQFLAERLRRPGRNESAPRGGFWGFLAGYTSFVSHAGGPPFQAYVLPLKMDKELLSGTTVMFFAVVNAIKVAPYFLLGQFDARNLSVSALLLPAAIAAAIAGVWLVRRSPQTLVYNAAYLALVAVGAKLIADSIAASL
jgi:hypothetical protein